jgi:hypothetical protein
LFENDLTDKFYKVIVILNLEKDNVISMSEREGKAGLFREDFSLPTNEGIGFPFLRAPTIADS